MVGDLTEIIIELDLKSSLPVGSKFAYALPGSVFYAYSEDPRCKEHSESSFDDCLEFTT